MSLRYVLRSVSLSSRNANVAWQMIAKDLWALRLRDARSKVPQRAGTDTETSSSQVFSSQSESETGTASRRSRSRDRGPGEATPNLSDTLAITYIGMLLLRTPVTVADISKWINAGDLLYYRANKQVPLEMRERLPGRYTSLLEPQEILPAESLHQHILKTLKMLGEVSGLVPPALNTPLVLYRWIRDLALPLEIFAASQRLAKLLNIDAAFQLSASGNANVVLRYPEVRMMALVMITTKLLFPFDDTKRYARSETDLSALAMDWNGWCLAKKKSTAPSEALSYQQAFEFTESDCLAADDDKLDAYLGWVERNVTSEEVRERGQAGRDAAFRRFLFDMFPLENGHVSAQPVSAERSASETDARVGHDQTKMVARRVAERAMNAHRPGALYRRYRDVEELSGPARVLFEEAAKLAGVSLPGMVQAVFLIERRLQKIEENHRKATSTT